LICLPPILAYTKLQSQFFLFYLETALVVIKANTVTKGVLVGKPEGKRPLGRPRCSWEDNVKMDLQDVGVRTGLGWLRIGICGGHL
jgi:hypothetical protein